MSIETIGAPTDDVIDNPTRQLGQVGITSNYQDAYLPLIFEQLQLISVLLAIIANENINLEEKINVEDLISFNENVLELDGDI